MSKYQDTQTPPVCQTPGRQVEIAFEAPGGAMDVSIAMDVERAPRSKFPPSKILWHAGDKVLTEAIRRAFDFLSGWWMSTHSQAKNQVTGRSLTAFLLILAGVVLLSAHQGYAQTSPQDALEQRQKDCNMTYQWMESTDGQFQALCIQAFSLQCMKNQALAPSYREQYPQVTDQQLKQGIRDIEQQMRAVCALLRPGMREHCAYCQP